MDQFNPQTIVNLLIIGVVLYVAVRGFIAYCNRVDAEWAAKNPPEPDQQAIAADHVAKILPASLRTPLAQYRNMDHAARYAGAAESEGGHHD